ncbi:MAG: hypothetical protein A3H95_06845 [Acidobacteria bacterium RIFCSPLOWO2_02_FULL_64_15]|nr:MAG: hypothetical protein A3H95_06845 [Acidobacteria bacterium RIFCSPLOWO2_02_FULL_64_15]
MVLVPELNSPQVDQRPAITHDGKEIFISSNRAGTLGGLDLWVSTRTTTLEAWSPPVNLGFTVNSPFVEIAAAVSSDRETLFFGSDRPGGLGLSDLRSSSSGC